MKKTILSLLIILSTVGFFAHIVNDQLNPLMTGVPSFSIAPDAVSGGLGDAGAAIAPNVYSLYCTSYK